MWEELINVKFKHTGAHQIQDYISTTLDQKNQLFNQLYSY